MKSRWLAGYVKLVLGSLNHLCNPWIQCRNGRSSPRFSDKTVIVEVSLFSWWLLILMCSCIVKIDIFSAIFRLTGIFHSARVYWVHLEFRKTLFDLMLRQGVRPKYVSIMKALYSHTTGRVRTYGQLSESFETSNGVHQRISTLPPFSSIL